MQKAAQLKVYDVVELASWDSSVGLRQLARASAAVDVVGAPGASCFKHSAAACRNVV